jgi:uracil-DNA glycosylase
MPATRSSSRPNGPILRPATFEPATVDERRRLSYLGAMGIDVWVPRGPAARPIETFSSFAAMDSTPDSDSASGSEQPDALDPKVAISTTQKSAEPDRVGMPFVEGLSSFDPAEMDWGALELAVAECRACALCETRTQTVFGVGSRTADLLIIGEAPGADEDRAGEPFVGRAGQLLNRMLAAIDLRREQVFIANVLKCRPPGNRDPRPDEAEKCEGYLMRQIELIEPRLILCVGRVAAQHLLQTDAPVGHLRGRWLGLGPQAVPLRVTYHPAYLLRSPDQKAKAWDDLTAVGQRLRGL